MPKEIYLILQEIMEEKGLSIASVAQMCSLPDSTVRGIINRKQKSTALEVAFKLSNGLGVSLERLNGDEDAQKKPTFQSKRLEYLISVTGKDNLTELSAQAGVDVMTFTNWLTGQAQPPQDKVELLASFLGATCDYLMGLTDDPKEKIAKKEGSLSDEALKIAALFDKADERDKETVRNVLGRYKNAEIAEETHTVTEKKDKAV